MMASLNDQMELGHVIEVTAKGEILDSYDAYVESSVEQPLDSNGDAIGEPEPRQDGRSFEASPASRATADPSCTPPNS
ncbi:hypothetical protein GCM10020255_025740 [Rhodococcus baikonurensis]